MTIAAFLNYSSNYIIELFENYRERAWYMNVFQSSFVFLSGPYFNHSFLVFPCSSLVNYLELTSGHHIFYSLFHLLEICSFLNTVPILYPIEKLSWMIYENLLNFSSKFLNCFVHSSLLVLQLFFSTSRKSILWWNGLFLTQKFSEVINIKTGSLSICWISDFYFFLPLQ